ncbi:MAG: hypothetical protein EYC70_15410 [Planctomycetota bacterium]|nr:MAG: hypothetical protein EYC70_15410 [Planctomycetota bacterium]
MRRWHLTPFIALLCLAARTPAQAPEMIGVNWFGELFTVDPATGQAIFQNSTGVGGLNAMARDSQGRIYAASNNLTLAVSDLYRLELGTGTLVCIGRTPLQSIRGLAFGPGDVLYAVDSVLSAPIYGTNDLYTLDPATASGVLVGAMGAWGVQGLAYGNGILYGWAAGTGTGFGDGLVRIDPLTAATADVNFSVGGSASEVQALCFDAAGLLYGMRDTLYLVNPQSGVLTAIGGSAPGPDIRGLEFRGGGGSGFSLFLSGTCGGVMEATVSGATPHQPVAFFHCTGPGGGHTILRGPCAGTVLDLNASTVLGGVRQAGRLGNARIGPRTVPSGACGRMRVQALDVATCATSNVALVQ